MQNRKLFVTISCLGICLFILHFVTEAKGQTIKRVVVAENSLRRNAIKTVIPKYPKEAIKARASGVAVTEITISEDGSVIDVKILETPHKSINGSMTEALKQWKFHPAKLKGKPQKITGKITYYFVLGNKEAKVESPF
jgi:TonB family protein